MNSLAAVMLSERFVLAARAACEQRLTELYAARGRAEESLDFLNRTIDTFEGACRLHAIASER